MKKSSKLRKDKVLRDRTNESIEVNENATKKQRVNRRSYVVTDQSADGDHNSSDSRLENIAEREQKDEEGQIELQQGSSSSSVNISHVGANTTTNASDIPTQEDELKKSGQQDLSKSKTITEKYVYMRGIVVDWLVELQYRYRLQTATLWLSVNIFDRYLGMHQLEQKKVQLLGITCFFIASKFEEVSPPQVGDCVAIVNNAYSRNEVLDMELTILSMLDYQLCVQTGYHTLTHYINLVNANATMAHLAFYYAERNLQEPLSLAVNHEQLAAAALYCALVFENQAENSADQENSQLWPNILKRETGFNESDLLPIARFMLQNVGAETVTASNRRLIAAKQKYQKEKYLSVSKFPLPTL